MVAKNFYDAVVVGFGLESLLAGALLAKRGFRVLLVAQGEPWPSYEVRGVRFPRAPFALHAHSSPALLRVFSELALKPLLQRRMRPLSPAFQAVLPGHRIDLSGDRQALSRELERELPSARRPADALWHKAEESGQQLDRLLARDLMWPPHSFLERREFARASLHAPFGRARDAAADGPHELEAPFARVLDSCLRFVSGGSFADGATPRNLRLLSSLLSAAELRDGCLSGLYELLLDSIRTHNGSLRSGERADALSVRRGALESVHLSPSDEELGCHFLLWGLPVNRLRPLLLDRSELDPLFAEVGEPEPRYLRFTLNLQLAAAGVPEGMARDVLLLHEQPLWVQTQALADGSRALLSAQTLISLRDFEQRALELSTLRERILQQLEWLSPFLREHLELVDSPHDGLPIADLRAGATLLPDQPTRRGPETMETVYAFRRPRLHGAAALTVRTPIKRLLLCNTQVVSGLGLEGSFLTAWSAARAVTRGLNRSWMNRGRWTKVGL